MRNDRLVIEDADVHLSILRKIATEAGRIGRPLKLNGYPSFSEPINLPSLRQTRQRIAGDADRHRLARAAGW